MGERTNRKRVISVVVAVAVLVVMAFFVIVFLTAPPPSPLFTVTGKVQPTESVGGGYEVMSWNFTFAYRGTNALQNVNIYLNNGNMPIKSVPEVPKAGQTNTYGHPKTSAQTLR